MANQQNETSKGSKQAGAAAAGGRGERQVQQRNKEQAQAGHDKGAEVPRDGVKNVKSEPHWDPTEAPDAPDAE